MSVAIISLLVFIMLFIFAFFAKRRFGVLGLALAAGSVLSGLWTDQLTPIIKTMGIELAVPPLMSVVAGLLVLAPALLLIVSGPAYTKLLPRLIGSGFFALLAFAFLLEPLGSALILQGDGKLVYDFLVEYHGWIVTAGLLFAVFDLLTTKTTKYPKSKR